MAAFADKIDRRTNRRHRNSTGHFFVFKLRRNSKFHRRRWKNWQTIMTHWCLKCSAIIPLISFCTANEFFPFSLTMKNKKGRSSSAFQFSVAMQNETSTVLPPFYATAAKLYIGYGFENISKVRKLYRLFLSPRQIWWTSDFACHRKAKK